MQIKIIAGLMVILLFGFSGQYLVNLASADDSWSDIQKAAAYAQARALQKYAHTHVLPLDQSTHYAGLTNTPTDETVYNERNANIAYGQTYAAAKGITIFGEIHVLGLDKFSAGYAGLTNTPTDETVHIDRNTQIALALAQMDKNNIKIIEALASIQPKYVGIDNTQTTDSNGRDRNVMIQEGIDTINQKIVGCYDADHPKTCNITSGAKYVQYAP
ncbi:MAG: hypothetical protein E6L02_02320 [Thaumarchaeota archaeon]|nr:MAG: hypothetical protein E6L02_02320 [Nitrososphaerota archaeon]